MTMFSAMVLFTWYPLYSFHFIVYLCALILCTYYFFIQLTSSCIAFCNVVMHASPFRDVSMPAVEYDLSGGLPKFLWFIMYQEYMALCNMYESYVNLIWYLYLFYWKILFLIGNCWWVCLLECELLSYYVVVICMPWLYRAMLATYEDFVMLQTHIFNFSAVVYFCDYYVNCYIFLYDNKRESTGFIRNAEVSIIINPYTAYLGHWQFIFNHFWQTIPLCPQWPHTCVGTAGDKILFAKFDWTWSEILLKPLYSSNVFQYFHVDIYLPISEAWPEMCHFINACVNL